ncbi:hypothetical protein PV325_005378 [Microctonus aethiopoides]|nr:hypothetical protein PV325_005378 [Microctonus aethiopoides]
MSELEIKIKNRGTGDRWLNNSNIEAVDGTIPTLTRQPTKMIAKYMNPNTTAWHIPRPSLVGHSEKESNNGNSLIHYHMHLNSSSNSCTSSQGSAVSTHSAASSTLLLTTDNLANFTAFQQPITTTPKSMDTASIASSTHFTLINGPGRPAIVNKKSWCARNQLTFLVCTMSALFLIALLIVIVYMELRVRDKYD